MTDEGSDMWRGFLLAIGVLVGAYASVPVFFASHVRFDTFGEFEWVLRADIEFGAALAMAVMICSASQI